MAWSPRNGCPVNAAMPQRNSTGSRRRSAPAWLSRAPMAIRDFANGFLAALRKGYSPFQAAVRCCRVKAGALTLINTIVAETECSDFRTPNPVKPSGSRLVQIPGTDGRGIYAAGCQDGVA